MININLVIDESITYKKMTRYSVQPRDQIFVNIYGFLSFPKDMERHLSSKYSQKLFDLAKQSATDTIKATSKRSIQKAGEATFDKITKVSKTSPKYNSETVTHKEEILGERYISPELRQKNN